MNLQDKYRSVLDLGEKLGVQNGKVTEEGGVLKIWGTAHTQYEKDQLWDKIKEVGGTSPTDLVADIGVATKDYYTKHTVKSGESLSKIAKEYYKDAMAYKKIFDANRDVLKDPDLIHPGQVLTIPNNN